MSESVGAAEASVTAMQSDQSKGAIDRYSAYSLIEVRECFGQDTYLGSGVAPSSRATSSRRQTTESVMEGQSVHELKNLLEFMSFVEEEFTSVEQHVHDLLIRMKSDLVGEALRYRTESLESSEESQTVMFPKLVRKCQRRTHKLLNLIASFKKLLFNKSAKYAERILNRSVLQDSFVIADKQQLPVAIRRLIPDAKNRRLYFCNDEEYKISAIDMTSIADRRTIDRHIETIVQFTNRIESFCFVDGEYFVVLLERTNRTAATERQSVGEHESESEGDHRACDLLLVKEASSLSTLTLDLPKRAKGFKLLQLRVNNFMIVVYDTPMIYEFRVSLADANSSFTLVRLVCFKGDIGDMDYNPRCAHGAVTFGNIDKFDSEVFNRRLQRSATIRKVRPGTSYAHCAVSRHKLCFMEDPNYSFIYIFDLTGKQLKYINSTIHRNWKALEQLATDSVFLASWALLEDRRELAVAFQAFVGVHSNLRSVGDLKSVRMRIKPISTVKLHVVPNVKAASVCDDSRTCVQNNRLLIERDKLLLADDNVKVLRTNALTEVNSNIYFVDVLNRSVKRLPLPLSELTSPDRITTTEKGRISGMCFINEHLLAAVLDCAMLRTFDVAKNENIQTYRFWDDVAFRRLRAYALYYESMIKVAAFGSNVVHGLSLASGSYFVSLRRRYRLNAFVFYAHCDRSTGAITFCLKTVGGHYFVAILNNDMSLKCCLPKPELAESVRWRPLRCVTTKNWCIVATYYDFTLRYRLLVYNVITLSAQFVEHPFSFIYDYCCPRVESEGSNNESLVITLHGDCEDRYGLYRFTIPVK